MSQRRQKKQLSPMDNISSLTDQELREALKEYDLAPGPITDSTRNLYQKKLLSLIEAEASKTPSKTATPDAPIQPSWQPLTDINDDYTDPSDEDYNYEEEEDDDDDEEDEDEEYEDESELYDEKEDLVKELETSSSMTRDDRNSTSMRETNGSTYGKALYFLMIFAVIALASFMYTSRNGSFSIPSQFKNMTRQLLIFIGLSPIVYAVYRIFRFYQNRRNKENQRVCELVTEALELLQSPDNPKGMMPILHIRDTLLTAVERKSNSNISLWNKAVKFVEDHESRVKVELVNIDGEDFRAWKWIGSRKL